MSIATAYKSIVGLEEGVDPMIDRAARGGFTNEQDRIAECQRVMDYFNLDGAKYIARRRADTSKDQPTRCVPLLRRAVKILCSHLYSPGPTRKIQDDEATSKWLEAVYRDNLFDNLMQRADELATLNGVSAIQVDEMLPEDGVGEVLKPIKLYVWGADQLIIYPDKLDCTRPAHVVTIDRYDEQTRYTWWSDKFKRVYLTDKLTTTQTSGGRTATYNEELSDPDHGYGRLPFGFVYHELPTTDCYSQGIGSYLADYNYGLDIEATDMADAVSKYHTPKGFIYNGRAEQQVDGRPGEFTRLIGDPSADEVLQVRVEYLQAQLDIESGLLNIEKGIDFALEGLGIPQTLYRMNQSTLPSGAAQVAEQQPLVDYSQARQEPFKSYETDIATAIVAVGSKATGDATLAASAAGGLNLTCRWPSPSIRTPGPEQDLQDQNAVSSEQESLVMVIQRKYRYSSEKEAKEHLQKVAEDNKWLDSIGLGPEAAAKRMIAQQAAQDPEVKQDQAKTESQADANVNRVDGSAQTAQAQANREEVV